MCSPPPIGSRWWLRVRDSCLWHVAGCCSYSRSLCWKCWSSIPAVQAYPSQEEGLLCLHDRNHIFNAYGVGCLGFACENIPSPIHQSKTHPSVSAFPTRRPMVIPPMPMVMPKTDPQHGSECADPMKPKWWSLNGVQAQTMSMIHKLRKTVL